MKPTQFLRAAALVTGMAVMFACNKNSVNNGGTGSDNATDLSTQADDEAMVSNEDGAIANDVSTTLYYDPTIAGTSATSVGSATTAVNSTTQVNGAQGPILNLICDASVVINSDSATRTITITYNGTNCWGNRTRTGVVVITIPAGVHWEDKGAVVSATIQSLVITRIRDGKSITINGNKTFTNVSGGLLKNLASLGTITHTVTGELSVDFADNTNRSWNVSKQRVFTYDNGIVITTTGTYNDNDGHSNVAEWGVNRKGENFESLITGPKIIRQDCDFRLTGGENTVLRSDGASMVIDYGLDASGNPTSCPGSGNYYMKVVVTKANGVILTKILPY
jgi:hypothetical protein